MACSSSVSVRDAARSFSSTVALILVCSASWFVGSCGSGAGPTDEPSISITHPPKDAVVSESRFEVRGKASGVETIRVDGEQTEVVGGEWSLLLAFDQGPVTVTAESGNTRVQREFTVDSHAPELELDSPERATFVGSDESTEVVVRGRVEDAGTGVRLVSVEGVGVEVAADGTFETAVELETGLNVLEVEAFDRADNRADVLRGVVHGPIVSPTRRIEPGFRVEAAPSALETASDVAESYLTPDRMTSFARENLDVAGFELERIDYETLEIGTSLQPGTVGLRVAVAALELEGTAVIDDQAFPVVVTIDEAAWTGDLRIEVGDSNGLQFDVRDPKLELEEQDFHFALRDGAGNRENVDVDVLRQLAVDVARRAMTRSIEGDALETLWDPALLEREVVLLGRRLVFEVVPLEIRIRPGGMALEGAVSMPAERRSEVPEVRGALDRPLGSWSPPDLDADAAVRTNRTAVERIGHGVWRAGLLHQSLRNEDLSGYDLPAELNADALALAVDERIDGLAEGQTPAAVRLRPLLPPTAAFSSSTGEEGALRLRMGEILVDLLLVPEGEPPITIATVAVFLDLDVDVSLDGFDLQLSFSAETTADLEAEPQFDFDDPVMEGFVEGLMESVQEFVGDRLTIAGESDLDWVELKRPQLSVSGERDDRLSFSVEVEPNPDALSR